MLYLKNTLLSMTNSFSRLWNRKSFESHHWGLVDDWKFGVFVFLSDEAMSEINLRFQVCFWNYTEVKERCSKEKSLSPTLKSLLSHSSATFKPTLKALGLRSRLRRLWLCHICQEQKDIKGEAFKLFEANESLEGTGQCSLDQISGAKQISRKNGFFADLQYG